MANLSCLLLSATLAHKRRTSLSPAAGSLADGPGVYLAKHSDELVSHCKCATALVTLPGQASCPWCGCGWLFSCIRCRKAFTFAIGVRTDRAWEELATEDIRRGGWTMSDDSVDDWVADMRHLLAGIEVGRRYVFFDGAYLPADAGPIKRTGWYAHHDLARAPQTAALADPSVIEDVLANSDYWFRNERPDRE